MAEIRWYCCEKCNEVEVYEVYADGNTSFPRGEFMVHNQYITADFKTRREAQSWLNTHLNKFDLTSDPLYAAAPETPVCGEAPLLRPQSTVAFLQLHPEIWQNDPKPQPDPADTERLERIKMLREAQRLIDQATESMAVGFLSQHSIASFKKFAKNSIEQLINAIQHEED